MQFLVSRTYSDCTPESAELGCYDDTGYLIEPEVMTLREVLRELETVHYDGNGYGLSIYGENYTLDYSTGTDRTECVHIFAADGKPLKDKHRNRIKRLANIN